MEILDAEWQWDRRKLTFYYTAEQRVDFRELVRELFRIWKTRVWLCVVPLEPPVGQLADLARVGPAGAASISNSRRSTSSDQDQDERMKKEVLPRFRETPEVDKTMPLPQSTRCTPYTHPKILSSVSGLFRSSTSYSVRSAVLVPPVFAVPLSLPLASYTTYIDTPFAPCHTYSH